MKNWINKNYKTLIITTFLVPIITVAIVSISHVTIWYGISNPVTWSIYLSIGIEIAALSALAAISANMGSKVYFPFAIVTIVQFIGNIFFAYSYIDINSRLFKDWVDLVSPMVEYLGVESTDFVGHKRFLAFFSGGMLPIISLSFLHMLVKFTEEDKKNQNINTEQTVEIPTEESKVNEINSSELIGEISRLRLSEDDLKKLEDFLLKTPLPNENLTKSDEEYKNSIDKEETNENVVESSVTPKNASEMMLTTNDDIISSIPADDEISEMDLPVINNEHIEEELSYEPTINESIVETNDKEKQREALIEMMRYDEELGLYNETFDNKPIENDLEYVSEPVYDFPTTSTKEEQNLFENDEVLNEQTDFEISVESVVQDEIPQESPSNPINSEELVEKKNSI